MEAHFLWAIAGVALAAVEMLTGDFTLLTIGIATGSTALPAWLGMSTSACLAWLAAANLILFLTVRPALQRWALASTPAIASNVSALVGEQVTVSMEQGVPWGKAGGDDWRLECPSELTDGERVRVTGIDGARLQVAPIS